MKILSVFLAFALLISGGISYWLYSSLNTPTEHEKADEFITIEKGSSPSHIIGTLISEGIISNSIPIKVYLRTFGDASQLRAGDYKFKSPITSLEVLEELKKGSERTIKLTIPEGWTRFEIAKRIANKFPVDPPMDEKAVFYLMNNTTQIRDFSPNAKNLEGFLYPTTYSFPPKTTPQEIITRMVGQFRKTWKPEWTSKAEIMGRTPYEIVTIASLIENESKVDSEREIVASVIYNRLNKKMALGIDATNVYIAKLLGKWDGIIHKSDIEVNHPYNTRQISGLPPGPISSASESALKAALNPAKTDYLFYVLNVDKNDGSHNFYASAAAFEKGKAKYQRWLATQRSKN